jgi:hypothetical protein
VGGGGGEDHILKEFNTLYLTRFRTYKIALSPQTKTEEGRGFQTDKHLPQSPFKGQLFRYRKLAWLSISLILLRISSLKCVD